MPRMFKLGLLECSSAQPEDYDLVLLWVHMMMTEGYSTVPDDDWGVKYSTWWCLRGLPCWALSWGSGHPGWYCPGLGEARCWHMWDMGHLTDILYVTYMWHVSCDIHVTCARHAQVFIFSSSPYQQPPLWQNLPPAQNPLLKMGIVSWWQTVELHVFIAVCCALHWTVHKCNVQCAV